MFAYLAKGQLTDWSTELRSKGWVLTYKEIKIRGFPFNGLIFLRGTDFDPPRAGIIPNTFMSLNINKFIEYVHIFKFPMPFANSGLFCN